MVKNLLFILLTLFSLNLMSQDTLYVTGENTSISVCDSTYLLFNFPESGSGWTEPTTYSITLDTIGTACDQGIPVLHVEFINVQLGVNVPGANHIMQVDSWNYPGAIYNWFQVPFPGQIFVGYPILITINLNNGTGGEVSALVYCNCEFPLPVELVSFDVIAQERYDYIYWVTGSEINNDYFLLEYSGEDFIYTPIKTFPGAGNSNTPTMYDHKMFNIQPGDRYYRLSQYDFNGDETIYPPTVISRNSIMNEYSYYEFDITGKLYNFVTDDFYELEYDKIYIQEDQFGNRTKIIRFQD